MAMMTAGAGYSAVARIERVAPRLRTNRGHAPWVMAVSAAVEEREVVDLTGEPFATRLSDGWESFREAVSQTTFYLTDPNSWR
jgi:hypothetical protein